MAFKTIETQEEFDQVIKDRLERERTKIQKEMEEKLNAFTSENAQLKEQVTEFQKTIEKAGEKDTQIKQLEGKLQEYERANLKRKIALENGIPYRLADRIQGDDEQSMTEDAKNLSSYFKADPTN